MKTPVPVFLLLLLLASAGCSIKLKSVVDPKLASPYQNPLIVIPYDKGTTDYLSKEFKEAFEILLRTQKRVGKVTRIDRKKEELALNQMSANEATILEIVGREKNDLLLILNTTKIYHSNYSVSSASFEMVGIDTKTQLEVWKASISSTGSLTYTIIANKVSQKILSKLLEDKVLQ